MTLKGGRELRNRLEAIQRTPEVVGREWAGKTAQRLRAGVPVKSGDTRDSIRVRSITPERVEIEGSRVVDYLDSGTRPHEIDAKRNSRLKFRARTGNTVFARKVDHPGTRRKPFKERAIEDGMKDTDMSGELVKLWNGAA